MLPLFRHTFRVDVGVPNHRSRDERVRHSPGRESNVADAFVAYVGLTDVKAVAGFRERAATGFVADGYISRTRSRAGLEAQTEEPVIHQRAAQSETQAVAGAISLRVFACRRDPVRQTSLRGANFVTHASIAIELDLSDGRGDFPFTRGSSRGFPRQFAANFLGLLVGDDLLLHEQIEQRPSILRACA